MTIHLILLPLLFALSGLFSASETALFSLRREDRKWLKERGTRAARAVLDLIEHPHSLLTTVLFGNLVVNFLLMAICGSLVLELGFGGVAGLIAGFLITTVAVVVAGEVVPKAIAVSMPRRVALVIGPILLIFHGATRWATLPLERLVAVTLNSFDRRWPGRAPALTDQELKRFVELHGEEGEIERQASEFLAEALELRSRRVHEVMTPRVDLAAIDLNQTDAEAREAFMALVRERRVGKVPVFRGEGLDSIDGFLRTRDVLADPETPLAQLVRKVWFVPATKSLESLLREMIASGDGLALVVGEYGGTHGLVTLEDVIEEITGDIARRDALPLLRHEDDGRWTMVGRFPLREVEELLGIKFEAPGTATLSGFVSHKLGRIPEAGDVIWHAGVQFSVASVERRRAQEIRVGLPRPGRPVPQDEVSPAMTHSGAQRASRRMRAWVEESQPSEELIGSSEVEPPRDEPAGRP